MLTAHNVLLSSFFVSCIPPRSRSRVLPARVRPTGDFVLCLISFGLTTKAVARHRALRDCRRAIRGGPWACAQPPRTASDGRRFCGHAAPRHESRRVAADTKTRRAYRRAHENASHPARSIHLGSNGVSPRLALGRFACGASTESGEVTETRRIDFGDGFRERTLDCPMRSQPPKSLRVSVVSVSSVLNAVGFRLARVKPFASFPCRLRHSLAH